MEIILTRHCESLTGSIDSRLGYHIQRRKNGFFGKRNSKGVVPCIGHILFIFACANLAKKKLYIEDIRVPAKELQDAIEEALEFRALRYIEPDKVYNAAEIIQFKEMMQI